MITRKIGNILTAVEIVAHLMASMVLAVDLNENKRIIARLIKKGFKIFEVRLAMRCLVSDCLRIDRSSILPELNML